MSSRGRHPADIWLYGAHAVVAALENPRRPCHRLLLARESGVGLERAVSVASERDGGPHPERTDRAAIEALLPHGAVHQGIALRVGGLPPVNLGEAVGHGGALPPRIAVALDRINDPHNLGAIVRSAAAFGACAVIMTERHAPPVSGVTAKAASGALEIVPLVRATNLARTLSELKKAGFWVLGLDPRAEMRLAAAVPEGDVAIVLGAEGGGLRRLTAERCDALCHLPTAPGAESLNVSNAAAIALYEIRREPKRSRAHESGPDR